MAQEVWRGSSMCHWTGEIRPDHLHFLLSFQHDPQLPVRKQAEQRQDSTHWGGNGDNNPGGHLNNEDPLVGSHQQETQETNPDATKDKPSPGDNNCQVTQALQRSSTFSKDRGCKILTGGPSSHQVLVIISLLQPLISELSFSLLKHFKSYSIKPPRPPLPSNEKFYYPVRPQPGSGDYSSSRS